VLYHGWGEKRKKKDIVYIIEERSERLAKNDYPLQC